MLRAALLSVVLPPALGIPVAAAAAAEPKPLPVSAAGWDVEVGASGWTAGSIPPAPADADPNLTPLVIRFGLAWGNLENPRAEYHWEALDAAVADAGSAGLEIILNPHGTNAAYPIPGARIAPDDTEAIAGWSAFLRALAGRYGDRVRFFQVGRFPDRDPGGGGGSETELARSYAYLLKKSAVAIRSAAPDALVALATISSGSIGFMSAVLDEEVAPYGDALAVSFDGSDKAREDLKALAGLLLTKDPGAKLWITGVRLLLGNSGYGDLLRAYIAGLDREVALVTFDDAADAQGRPFHFGAMDRARRLFTTAYSPLVESGRGVRVFAIDGSPLPDARASRFFDPDGKIVLMAYEGGGAVKRGDFGVFVVDSTDIAEPVLRDLASGESSAAVTMQKDPNSGLTRLALPLAEYPLVLSYRRFTTPEYAKLGEKVAVTGERLPTAEEIIARMQATQAAQDAILKSLRADAKEEWHFSVGASGSFDVAFDESFYLDPNVGAEWEQREIFINGVRWKLKTIPELPFVNPEKVVSLPLRITLAKDYTYSYEGRESVSGFDCYIVRFEPIERSLNLASGRVWVDTVSGARVRIAMVQGNLAAPVISNDQRDTYAPVSGPGGLTYWVLSRIEAQQIYSIGGANFVLNKAVDLSGFHINDASFAAARGEALASSHQILRDTDRGLRYTEKKDDGSRVVKAKVSHQNLFLVGGALYNPSFDYPIPLAGVNYFDSDLFGRGWQTDILYAGVLVFANLSNPRFLGTKMDASADLGGFGISLTDPLFRTDPNTGNVSKREKEGVKRKTQILNLGLGFPFGKFFKIKAEGQLDYDAFGASNEKCDSFIVPRDTTVRSGILRGEFHRKAWNVALHESWSERQTFERWGLDASTSALCPVPAGTAQHPDFFEGAGDFTKYGADLSKEFYLPFSQKIHVELSGLGSRDLDRFSKYQFGLFDDRLRGFSGSGLRFTDGAVAHLIYNFSLADVIRFEAAVDRARVRDRQLGEEFHNFTGVGVAGQFIGPWGLLIQLDIGRVAASDIPEYRGGTEFRLEFLKLFSQH